MDERIFKLRDNLLTHLDRNWTVKEMAEKAGLSISRFPTVFKAEIKMSPSAFLKEERLKKAKNLLEDPFIQIQQIGIKVGMKNESHFTRDFRIRYHLTPTECRRQHQEKQQADLLNQEAEPENGQE